MKIDKIIQTVQEEELEFNGATLLSIKEAEKFLTKDERNYDWWWLRSPGYDFNRVSFVFAHGEIDYRGEYVHDAYSNCVRPALRIQNLEFSGFEIGDKFKIGEYEFKIISKNLAWLYKQDIGYYCFREDCRAENANNYEYSNIKKIVDKWFNEVIK